MTSAPRADGDLHGEVAHAAGGGANRDGLVLGDLQGLDERLPGGEPGQRRAARLRP